MLLFKLSVIGILAGVALAGMMHIIYLLTDNQAYLLLYNVDYIPGLRHFQQSPIFGFIFHFLFCIISVIVLFFLLQKLTLEFYLSPYLIVYTGGAAALYFLSALTEKPPAPTDFNAWFYWSISHVVYSLIVGLLIKFWIGKKTG